jgi:hypothetical protein
MKVNLFDPIMPNESLGGLRLRVHVAQLTDLVAGLGVTTAGTYVLASPFEARFSFGDGDVQCGVDIRNGKVFKLIATKNYEGTFQGRIRVGMAVQDAFRIDPRLYYDEAEETILCRGIEGIVFDVPVDDPFPSEVPSLTISSIAVFAAEINTLAGQEGRW